MKKSPRPFLSVVIPCYNEAHNVRLGALAQVAHFLEKKNYLWEVIIVDDGSRDDSRALIKEFISRNPLFRLIENSHQGKAVTVMTGVFATAGSLILFTDLDQATPIWELDKLLSWLNRGSDVVIGSRSSGREGAPFLRRAMAQGFISLRTLILGLSGIIDTQCGFKLFTRKATDAIFSRLKLYQREKAKGESISGSLVTAGFDVEILFLARKLGFEIKEVAVDWHYVESRRVNPLRDSWQGLIDLVKIKVNSLRGVYD